MIEVTEENFKTLVDEYLNKISDMLVEKNKKYGNSAINPKRVFSKADMTEQIKVRIDDKLSRIATATNDEDEDVRLDLIGYLVLLEIAGKYHD